MKLKRLYLQNFRSYKKQSFEFFRKLILIVGPNAGGKTNLLEAIYLLSTGKSFRGELDQEMINYEEKIAIVQGKLDNQDELEIILTRGQVLGGKIGKKIYKINGISKRMIDFLGKLRVVYFGPEDLGIVTDSPMIRRNYLDSILEKVDKDYRRANLSYKKGLKQRNKLLEQIRDKGKPRSSLYFWDRLLISNGQIITTKREELFNFINQQPRYFWRLFLDYQKNIISSQRLEKYSQEEIAAGMTLVGPHRDDFLFKVQEREDVFRNLHLFGSRGEQRIAIFCLKLAELDYITQKTNERPVLLLDDIFSELDHSYRQKLIEVIPRQQTIITTTDIHLVEADHRKKAEVIELKK